MRYSSRLPGLKFEFEYWLQCIPVHFCVRSYTRDQWDRLTNLSIDYHRNTPTPYPPYCSNVSEYLAPTSQIRNSRDISYGCTYVKHMFFYFQSYLYCWVPYRDLGVAIWKQSALEMFKLWTAWGFMTSAYIAISHALLTIKVYVADVQWGVQILYGAIHGERSANRKSEWNGRDLLCYGKDTSFLKIP